MPITNLGTSNELPSSRKPTGYISPVVAEFSDFEYRRKIILTVPKATVENASASTTMTNIIANATVGLNKQIQDIMAADYLSTANVTSYAELIDIRLNVDRTSDLDTTYLTNIATAYVCSVILYVKAL